MNSSMIRRYIGKLFTNANPRRIVKRQWNLESLEQRDTPTISYSTIGSVYTQNFDGLPSTGSFTVSGTTPIALEAAPINATDVGTGDWFFAQFAGGTTRFAVDTGSSGTGSAYSYGSTGASDRALGMLASGSNTSRVGVEFTNNTGTTLTSFVVSFTAETWRRGTDNANPNPMAFAYSVGATNISTGTFTTATTLDAQPTNFQTPDSAVNGNAANARVVRTAAVTGISWADGQKLVLRWSDADNSNNDDGVAIDDFSFRAGTTVQTLSAGDSITTALTAVGNDGIVIVPQGTYAEAVNLTGNQQIVFTGTGETTINSLTGGASNGIVIPTGLRLVVGDATDTTFAGSVSGAGALRKVGTGKLTISANSILNTLRTTATTGSTAAIDVQAGTLSVGQLSVGSVNLANIAAGAILETTGTLYLQSSGGSPLSLVTGSGTLKLAMVGASATNPDLFFGPNHRSSANWGVGIESNIDLGASERIALGRSGNNGYAVYTPNTDAMIRGAITGTGSLTIIGQQNNNDGDEVPYAIYSASNNFTGALNITRGSVYMHTGVAFSGSNALNFNPTANRARLFLYGNNVTFGSLTSSGAGTSGIANAPRATMSGAPAAGTITINQSVNGTYGGTINDVLSERITAGSATSGPLNFVKAGSATLTLSAANTYTGTTTINAGTLAVTNTTGSATGTGAVTVNTGATLAGTGTVTGSVTVNGTVSPGVGTVPGILNLRATTFTPGSALAVTLNGGTAGSGYDQLSITNGTIDLGNATLGGFSNFVYTTGAALTIVNVGTGATLTGQFSGYAEGSTVIIDGQFFTLSYVGGDGNDVVLVKQAPPTVYVDDAWTGFSNGQAITDADPVTTGNQAAVFGTTAFASVNNAINTVPALASVIVNAGAYSETVNINKQISLLVQEGPISFTALTDSVGNAAITLGVDTSNQGITLTFGVPTDTTIGSSFSGTGGLTVTGGGVLTLSGNNSYSGSTTVSGGVFKAGSATGLSSASAFSVASGATVQLNGLNSTMAGLTGAGTVENANATAATLTINAATSFTFGGTFQNGTGGGALSLVKSGAGTLTLTSANSSYTGSTTVSGGVLSVASLANGGANSSIGASTNAAANLVLSGGNLEYTGTSVTTDRSLTFSANTQILVTNAATTLTTSGTITGGTNTFTTDGPGMLILTTNIAFNCGNVAVLGGTLGFATQDFSSARLLNIAENTFAESSGSLRLIVNGSSSYQAVTGLGTLKLVGTANDAVNSPDINFGPNHSGNSFWGVGIESNLDLGSVERFAIGRSGNNGYAVYTPDTDAMFKGTISGTGSLTIIGQQNNNAGDEVPYAIYSASNNFAGALNITRGSVYLHPGVAFSGSNALNFNPAANRARLFLNGNNVTFGSLTSSGAGASGIANAPRDTMAGAPGAGTITINQSVDGTFAGTINDVLSERISSGTTPSGPLNFVKGGASTLTLTGINTYTGSTTLNAGVLSVGTFANGGVNSPIGASSNAATSLIFDGGTLRYTGGTVTTDRSFTVNAGNGTIEVTNAATTLTVSGSASGTGSITKTGAGVLELNGNYASNNLIVTAGTLGGIGTFANLTVSGTLSPATGTTVGTFNAQSLSFNSSAVYSINVDSSASGDKIVANDVALGNANITGVINYSAAIGDVITIIDNQGANAVTGTFNGLPENGLFLLGGQLFQISYIGGTGNDVTITRVTPPTYYVDDAWVGYSNGQAIPDVDPVTAGDQPGTFGTNAFATVNAGITAIPTYGTLVVNSGTYAEAVVVNKTMTLKVQEAAVSFNSLATTVTTAFIELSGISLTIGDTTDTTISSAIVGAGNLVKVGTGVVTLTAVNTFTGSTTINTGILQTGVVATLATSSSVNVAANGTLRLNGFSQSFSSITGTGIVENANAAAATLTVNNPTAVNFGGVLQDGTGGGALNLTKIGAGVLNLSGTTSSYTGTTTINGGALEVASLANGGSNSSIGASTNAAANLVLVNGVLLYSGASVTTDRNFTLGAGGGTINVSNAATTFTVSGVSSGSNSVFTKDGPGTLALTGTNALNAVNAGLITAAAGDLQIASQLIGGSGVEASQRRISIASGATVTSTGILDILPTDNTATFSSVIIGEGTLRLRATGSNATTPDIRVDNAAGDSSAWGASIGTSVDLGTTERFVLGWTNRNDWSDYSGDFRIDGIVSGTGGLTFVGGNTNGGHRFTTVLTKANTFTGALRMSDNAYVIPFGTTATSDSITSANAVVIDPASGQTGGLYLHGRELTIGSLSGTSAGVVRNGANTGDSDRAERDKSDSTLTIQQTVNGEFAGVLSDGPSDDANDPPGGTAYKLNIVKEGSATLTLSGGSTLTGTTTVNNGTLRVNGSLPAASTVTIANNATLDGTGAVNGSVTVNGTLAVGAGSTAGQLATGNLAFTSTGKLVVDLLGTTVGTQYDRVNTTGTVDLGGAMLILNLGSFTPAAGDSFVIVSNDNTDSITGNFKDTQGSTLTEGATFTVSNTVFKISYVGGDGNDVTLSKPAPAPSLISTLINGSIVPLANLNTSRITSIVLNFNTAVTADAGAFSISNGTLTHTSNANGGILVAVSGSQVTLTFDANVSGIEFGSLADGIWTLNTDLTKIKNVDNVYGTASTTTENIRRLFGDINGDNSVDGSDFAEFGNNWGLAQGDVGFNTGFDFNADNTIDGSDFAEFGNRWGVQL